jgi:cytosine/adenosine deaminase-related metal-dependent hydrolase
MARKPHPADIHDAKQIARAIGFVVYLRKNPRDVYREDAATIPEARIAEAAMNAAHGANGRRAIVYAITPEGAQYFVPDTMQ